MNVEKLKRLQAQVRIGGKGTPRRKKKVIHQTTAADDKKLQSSLKKLSVSTIPGIEEVNIIKDDLTVIHFNNPKAQASLSANTFSVTGHGDTKKIVEMLPEILPQLGQETVTQLRVFAGSMTNNQKQLGDRVESNLLASIEEDDVPLLVNDFDEIATKEDVTKGKTPESKSEQQHSRIESCLNKAKTDNIQGGSWCQNAILNDERKFCRESTANNSLPQSDGKEHNARTRTTDKTTNATSVTTTEKTGVSVKIGSSKLKTEGSKGTLISSKTNIGNVPDKYLNIRREGEYEVKAILENLPLNELHVIDVDSYAYLNRKITNSPTLESTEVIYTDQSAAKPKLSTGKTRKGNFADGKADAGKVKAVSSESFKPDLCCVPAEDKLKLISTEKGSNALKETQPIILDSGNVKDITHQTNNVVMAAHYEANKKGNAKQLMNLDTGVAKMGTAESKSVNLAKLQTVSMSSLILKGQEHDIQKQRIGAGLATNSTHGFESNEVSIHEVAKNTSLVAATFSPYAKKMSSAVNTFSLEIETGGYEKAKCTERPVSLELGLEDIKPLEENLTTLREIGNVSLTNMPPESKIETSQEPLIKAHDQMAVEDKGADATNSVDEKLSLCSEIRKEIYEEIYAQSKAQDATNKTIEKKPHSKVVKDTRKQQIKTLSPTTSTKTDAGLMKLNITEKPKKVLPPKAQTPSVSSSISTAQKIPITSTNRQEKSAVIPKPKLTVASPIKPQAGMPTKPPTTTHAKKPPTSPSSTDRTMKSTTATKSLHGGEPNAAIKSKTDNTKRDKILSRNPPGQGNQP